MHLIVFKLLTECECIIKLNNDTENKSLLFVITDTHETETKEMTEIATAENVIVTVEIEVTGTETVVTETVMTATEVTETEVTETEATETGRDKRTGTETETAIGRLEIDDIDNVYLTIQQANLIKLNPILYLFFFFHVTLLFVCKILYE